jgi:hypothetical protein
MEKPLLTTRRALGLFLICYVTGCGGEIDDPYAMTYAHVVSPKRLTVEFNDSRSRVAASFQAPGALTGVTYAVLKRGDSSFSYSKGSTTYTGKFIRKGTESTGGCAADTIRLYDLEFEGVVLQGSGSCG